MEAKPSLYRRAFLFFVNGQLLITSRLLIEPGSTFGDGGDLFAPKAAAVVVVDHAGGLHEGVADGRAHELEAAADQIFAQSVGFGGARRRMRAVSATRQ